ncbi:MAG: hypothetical protein ACPHL6_10690, partial [Rubripirellula sp.]
MRQKAMEIKRRSLKKDSPATNWQSYCHLLRFTHVLSLDVVLVVFFWGLLAHLAVMGDFGDPV